jgi:hypothetical protein
MVKEKIQDFDFDLVHLFEFDENRNSTVFWSYDIKLDKDKTVKFIEQYINKWSRDELFLPETNVLKASNQVQVVSTKIYGSLSDYPDQNLLFGMGSKEEIDYLATLLFLEELEIIEITRLELTPKGSEKISFRLNIKKKFYEVFKYDWEMGTSFNFEELVERKKQEEELPIILDFDSEKGTMIVKGIEITIRKNSDQYYLLEAIFRKKGETYKEWQFSEIAELIDPRIEIIKDKVKRGKIRKQYYNAVDQIKKKVAIESGIKDLFITSRQTVKINPKYKVA